MPKSKKKRPVEVEDHGNGFMVIGTVVVKDALAILEDYVEDVGDYIWATPTHYNGRGAVWLGGHVGAQWEGSRDPLGNLLKRD